MANTRSTKQMNEVREQMYKELEQKITFEGMKRYGRSTDGIVFEGEDGEYQTVKVVTHKKPELAVEAVEAYEERLDAIRVKAQEKQEKEEKRKKEKEKSE